MTDRLRAAAQAALEALINGKNVRAGEGGTKHQPTMEDAAIKQLRAALAEPDYWQEEARRYAANADYWRQRYESLAEQDAEPYLLYDDDTGDTWMPEAVAEGWALTDLRPLYVSPVRREWQGLTDEERQQILDTTHPDNRWTLAERVEYRLKEKNS